VARFLKVAFLFIVIISAVAQSEHEPNASDVDPEHTAWIAATLDAIDTIKVGMTRADLMKVFTTEGGLSTASQRTYVYRECPYIKIDVKFATSRRGEERPTDIIVDVSRPYLARSVMD